MTSLLQAHLQATGQVTEKAGVTRRARLRTCGRKLPQVGPRTRCRDLVLVGLDAERCAFAVAVDATPLSPLGEALAAVEGRRTFDLRRVGGAWVLDPRTGQDIAHHPAGTDTRRDVVRQHRCRTTAPDGPLATDSSFAETRPRPPADATPDF